MCTPIVDNNWSTHCRQPLVSTLIKWYDFFLNRLITVLMHCNKMQHNLGIHANLGDYSVCIYTCQSAQLQQEFITKLLSIVCKDFSSESNENLFKYHFCTVWAVLSLSGLRITNLENTQMAVEI